MPLGEPKISFPDVPNGGFHYYTTVTMGEDRKLSVASGFLLAAGGVALVALPVVIAIALVARIKEKNGTK